MPNYIDNKEFFEELKKRKELEEETGEKQPISDYLGKCFLDISTNLAQKNNFANYTFIEGNLQSFDLLKYIFQTNKISDITI